mmetsp:Transcript_21317/g.24324  ORF Transcript_21317/g.24324 Transcript_21317/m.24324 type:complete len:125 (+) Transcript_21317:68-442(+)
MMSYNSNDEKRRDFFDEAMQELSEIVFENYSSSALGRENNKCLNSNVASESELVEIAVEMMTQMKEKRKEQKATIIQLQKSLEAEKILVNHLLSLKHNSIKKDVESSLLRTNDCEIESEEKNSS